ncbi:MAG: hypothetical protein JSS49_00890 [Planctomycetes bacterium]|nr:hypothetical protein [Planctomycetota bacterium]
MEMRKQVEAVEAAGEKGTEEKKARKTPKAAAPRAKRTKEKVLARKRLVWVVYSGSMKEEGRFPYDQLAAAHEKIEQLKLKSKKMYFIQPVKEILGEGGVVIAKAVVDLDDEPVKPKKKAPKAEDDDDDDDDDTDDDDDE